MSESNNNIPMRITQLEEATEYPEGSYIPIAKAGWGTKKILSNVETPTELFSYSQKSTNRSILNISALYYQPEDKLIRDVNSHMTIFCIDKSAKDVIVSAEFIAGDSGFYIVNFMNEDKEFISGAYPFDPSTMHSALIITNEKIRVPNGAKYVYINSRSTNTPTLSVNESDAKKALLLSNECEDSIFDENTLSDSIDYTRTLYVPTSGLVTGLANYYCRKFSVNSNTKYYLTSRLLVNDVGIPLVAYTDENDDFISDEFESIKQVDMNSYDCLLNIPSNAAFFYVNSIYTKATIKQKKSIIENNVSGDVSKIFHIGTDKDFSNIKDCAEFIKLNNIKNSVVMVDSGDYDLVSEIGETFLNNYDGVDRYAGIQFCNNTHWIFAEGANLTFEYSGSNTKVPEYFSPLVVAGSCELENLNVEVSNCQYCIHDDWPERVSNWVIKYTNCKMKHNGNTFGTYDQTVCIGGGLLPNELVVIDGGEYTCPNDFPYPISYHSIWGGISGVHPSKIIYKNIWISGGFRFADAPSRLSDVKVYISNCSQGDEIGGTHTFFTIKEWNNIIRE